MGTADPSAAGEARLLVPRDVPLDGPRAMVVRRTLPHQQIRTIGGWCFVDHFGPRAFLLGGEPFGERLVMWWNFVGRDHDDIARARADWEADRRTTSGARLTASAGRRVGSLTRG